VNQRGAELARRILAISFAFRRDASFIDRLIKNLTLCENLPFFHKGSDIPAIEKTADPWELDAVKTRR